MSNQGSRRIWAKLLSSPYVLREGAQEVSGLPLDAMRLLRFIFRSSPYKPW